MNTSQTVGLMLIATVLVICRIIQLVRPTDKTIHIVGGFLVMESLAFILIMGIKLLIG